MGTRSWKTFCNTSVPSIVAANIRLTITMRSDARGGLGQHDGAATLHLRSAFQENESRSLELRGVEDAGRAVSNSAAYNDYRATGGEVVRARTESRCDKLAHA